MLVTQGECVQAAVLVLLQHEDLLQVTNGGLDV